MIIDANETAGIPEQTDICICGGGPAGISLAQALEAQGKSVLLIEGGGLEWTEESQSLYNGRNVGEKYFGLETARLRFLGGSSNHWTGHCGVLDALDFEAHDHHPLSGWPISKTDLDPYDAKTRKILDLPSATPEHAPMPVENENFRTWHIDESPPTLFNEKYLGELSQSKLIKVVLNLNVVDIRLNESRRAVTEIICARNDPESARIAIKATQFVLCMGGIENPRLLLNSNSQIDVGVGNTNGNVGIYFQEHPHATVGYAVLKNRVRSHFVSPTKKAIDAFEMLNFGLRIYTLDGQLAHNTYSRYKWKDAFKQSFMCGWFGMDDPLYTIGVRDNKCRDAKLWIAPEQSLNPNSKVALGAEKDRFGNQSVVLDWQLQDLDWHTMQQAVIRYGEYLVENNLGRVRIEDWLLEKDFGSNILGGFHHMCTTRMSALPTEGVVDADCKVHGVENLYIGGSSVFATGGHINPTFTIVQLALRLADHLARV